MRALDGVVLGASLLFIVVYGVMRSRRQKGLEGYLLAGRTQAWWTVALSIMATQASAITFLSTPGQAYADGMRFVQFYFGLPLAMVILCVTVVPLFHRLKVYTAYEYLEGRFDPKTRTLTAFLFLAQRGLACGLTIYAPALILSVLLGWSIQVTTVVIGGLVVVYTTSGGAKAVNETQTQQMVIILLAMGVALVALFRVLPDGVGFGDAVLVSGALGRMNAVDTTFDLSNRYNLWSGLIGGAFLSLSYFGTDQSQVQRYLTGRSVAQSRLGLLVNGLVKVPMQFAILFVGAMVFAFYQFVAPPLWFNPVEARKAAEGPRGAEMAQLEAAHARAAEESRAEALKLVAAGKSGDESALAAAKTSLRAAHARAEEVKGRATSLIKDTLPKSEGKDTNYVFLRFVLDVLPTGVVGLVLAAIFAASMSSTAAELNALSTTSVVDGYRRYFGKDAPDEKLVRISKWLTVGWGLFAIVFAQYASRLGTLVEAVNILGSFFYGTILGVFLTAFYLPRVKGGAAFWGALAGEVAVVAVWAFTDVSFLWLNALGCVVVVVVALAASPFTGPRAREAAA